MTRIITSSIFDIFKIGPGPSSSHTIGPMKAAGRFIQHLDQLPVEILSQITSIDIYLYGSLSATGLGHGTHKAVLGGLLGWTPEGCDPDQLLDLMTVPSQEYQIQTGDKNIPFHQDNIHFAGDGDDLPYPNTLVFIAKKGNETLLNEEFYSIGGGFILEKDEKKQEAPTIPHSFSKMTELVRIVNNSKQSLYEIIMENEEVLSKSSRAELESRLDQILTAMRDAVKSGLERDGVLPGPIGLQRKAQVLYTHSKTVTDSHNRFLSALNAYALAASEENAAGRKVVTAPTSGASGVIPGIVNLCHQHLKLSNQQMREGLVAAAAIAFVARHNASIAGAEVGCQGEVGVAAAMAAAFLTQANGGTIQQVENSAEIALEHHLGLTCDPVGGYVQVPCIERNAMGAVSAYNAYILATVGEPLRQIVSFDEVVEAMRITGKEMSSKYKETALGGLAVSCIRC